MVKRFKPPLRARIGKGRIPYSDESSSASFTRQVRKQLDAVIRNMKAWTEHMHQESDDVLFEALEPTFEKSKVYVPKDTQALLRSGYLEKRLFRGRGIVEIGYSRGGNPHYGPTVHENLEVYHAPPTRSRFLLTALEEDASAIQDRIAAKYKEASGV